MGQQNDSVAPAAKPKGLSLNPKTQWKERIRLLPLPLSLIHKHTKQNVSFKNLKYVDYLKLGSLD